MNLDPDKLRFGDENYGDLRDWLQQVEHLGELTAIRGADRDLEIPGIWEAVSREGQGHRPALLFDEIPGFPTGFRILFGQLESVRRLALTLRLNLDKADILSCVKACRDKLKHMVLVPPRKANNA